LQRALVVDGLRELALGDAALVEEHEPFLAAAGQALGAQVDPGLVHLAAGHEHGAAAVFELVRHAARVELGGDLTRVRRLELRVERGVLGRACPGVEVEHRDDDADDAEDREALLAGREPVRKALRVRLDPIHVDRCH